MIEIPSKELNRILNKYKGYKLSNDNISSARLKRLDHIIEWLKNNPKDVMNVNTYATKFNINKRTASKDMRFIGEQKICYYDTHLCKDGRKRSYIGKNKELVEHIIHLQ